MVALYPIGSMVLLYMVTWIPSIYPLYVSINTSTMDPMCIVHHESWLRIKSIPYSPHQNALRARSERRGAAESGSQLADSQDGLGRYDGYIPDMAGWEIPYKCYKWQCKWEHHQTKWWWVDFSTRCWELLGLHLGRCKWELLGYSWG